MLKTHGVGPGPRWAAAFVLPLVLGAGAYFTARWLLGEEIGELFGRISAIAAPAPGCVVLSDGQSLESALSTQTKFGTAAVSIAVASLLTAAACFAFRYQRHDINGAWSDSYVLRHKLKTLLTLFFIGSILLVITNVALNSAMEWSGAMLDVVSGATSPDLSKDEATDDQTTPGSKTAPGGASSASAHAPADPEAKAQAAAFASIKSLRTSVSNFAGILGSLVLVVIFVPALYAVTADIELAGKCHAFTDMLPPGEARQNVTLTVKREADERGTIEGIIAPDPPPSSVPDRIVVAGWKTVQDWKAKHGLKLSFTDPHRQFHCGAGADPIDEPHRPDQACGRLGLTAPITGPRAHAENSCRPAPRAAWRPCPFRTRSASECRGCRSAPQSPAPRRH